MYLSTKLMPCFKTFREIYPCSTTNVFYIHDLHELLQSNCELQFTRHRPAENRTARATVVVCFLQNEDPCK